MDCRYDNSIPIDIERIGFILMKRKVLSVLALFNSFLFMFSGCKQQVIENYEAAEDDKQLVQISLAYPYSGYNIQITENGYLTTHASENGEKVQQTVLLSASAFAKVCRKLERLDFSSKPQTDANGWWDVGLRFYSGNRSAYFPYGYLLRYWKTDKPFVDFVTTIIKLSPIPVINERGKRVRPIILPF